MSIQKYLDSTGLAYFWDKIKNWVTSRGYITSSGSITGNAATATRLLPQPHTTLPTGNLAQDGLQLVQVYQDGYPSAYGNVINIQGTNKGSGQLFLGWHGFYQNTALLYYRHKKDIDNTWSEWSQIAFFRYGEAGQYSNSTTNPWYKVATAQISYGNENIITTFLVEDTYITHSCGLLQIHVRFDSNGVVDTTQTTIQWLSQIGIDPSEFVLVCPTGANPTIELWTKITIGYKFRRFIVLSDGDRVNLIPIWKLFKISSEGQYASITTAGTQFVSQLNSYLPLSGGTLTGVLQSHYIRHKISGIDITDTTSGYVQDFPFVMCDKNNKDLTALLTYRYHSEGKTVQAFRVNNKNNKYADFRFEVNDNNSFVCYASAASGMTDATSFNDDGWTYVTAKWVRRHNRIVCNYGSDISKPYNCIVKTGSKITSNYTDCNITLLVEKPYTSVGGLGICQISLRTNDSNNVATCAARWLARTGNIAADCIQVGLINTSGSAACDIYYHITGGYQTVHVTVLSQSSGRYDNPNKATDGFVPFAATDDDWTNRQFASMNAGAQHYWGQNYSSTTYPVDENVVNSTTNSNVSDERFKSQISLLPENILDAWDEVDFYQFKFNEAAESKGLDNARLHSGLIAQQIDTIFKNHGLDASTYGFFCCDSQYEEVETQDADGNAIRNLVKVSDLYSIRYTEALCIEAAYQRHKNKILENRISELEKRLAKLEGIMQ